MLLVINHSHHDTTYTLSLYMDINLFIINHSF